MLIARGNHMSEASKQVLKRWFDEVWNQKREAAIDELFTPGGLCYGFPDDNSAIGIEEYKKTYHAFCGAFPDLHVELGEIKEDGNRASAAWVATMTHTGDHLGFPASGKKVDLHGHSTVEVANGRILNGWNQVDVASLFQKLQQPEEQSA